MSEPQSQRYLYDLPVDLCQPAESFQNRLVFIISVSILVFSTFVIFLLSVNVGFVLAKGASALPDIRSLEHWHPSQSTRIFDRKGNLIANIHGDEDRVVVPLDEISNNIKRAVMATEDTRFYQHAGIDFKGTARAVVQNMKRDDVQGGSTITQQLVKNLFLTPERSMGRKLAEALLSLRVEKQYDKNKILEMYLNQVYWGNHAYGIEKAARRYFRKPASELTIAESALLAGLLKAPEGLSPFSHPAAARARQLEVIGKMNRYGYITKEQQTNAIKEEIHLNTREVKPSKYPFFIAYIVQELIKEFGEDAVRRGGLKVYTALDQRVQDGAEKALISQIKSLPKSSNVTQGALAALDVETGHVIAMVGGKDFLKSQFNNATQARRAAGSTFKPIVYLTGFRLGLITPTSPISDRPIYFNTGYGTWSPKNWDGRYMGAMNIRRALVLSRNTPTVQIGMKVGIDEVIKTAKLAGITSKIDANFSSLLGSSGISPLEMLSVYSTFARGGMKLEPTGILKIEDARGQTVSLYRSEAQRVFESEPINNLVSILVDVVEQGTGKGARLPGRVVAGKTGTTDQVRDIWFAGFTPDMAAVVWMGNEKYVPLKGVFSSNSAKVWHDFAEKYYEVNPIPPSQFAFLPGKALPRKPRVLAPVPRRTTDPIIDTSTSPPEAVPEQSMPSHEPSSANNPPESPVSTPD
jgi:penicillin-binding protein 1A